MKQDKPKVLAVDFDGLLCHVAWPEIGKPRRFMLWYFKRKKRQGHKLILNTCREGLALYKAVVWCKERGLTFDAHNKNLPDRVEEYGGDCRKISADDYYDDKNHWLRPIRWRR